MKFYCPHCERFKKSWQTTEGWGEAVNTDKPAHCRHCGHEVIGITKEFQLRAIKLLLENSM